MQCPLEKISQWLTEEAANGVAFSQGAVLSTVSKNGRPRSRVVGTMLGNDSIRFHTSPNSRKVSDISHSRYAALTYSLNNSCRSITIEGVLTPLLENTLEKDWLLYDEKFRQSYWVFGDQSGNAIESIDELELQRKKKVNYETAIKPISFIGFEFSVIERISFYTVTDGNFAISNLYEFNSDENHDKKQWQYSLLVP